MCFFTLNLGLVKPWWVLRVSLWSLAGASATHSSFYAVVSPRCAAPDFESCSCLCQWFRIVSAASQSASSDFAHQPWDGFICMLILLLICVQVIMDSCLAPKLLGLIGCLVEALSIYADNEFSPHLHQGQVYSFLHMMTFLHRTASVKLAYFFGDSTFQSWSLESSKSDHLWFALFSWVL